MLYQVWGVKECEGILVQKESWVGTSVGCGANAVSRRLIEKEREAREDERLDETERRGMHPGTKLFMWPHWNWGQGLGHKNRALDTRNGGRRAEGGGQQKEKGQDTVSNWDLVTCPSGYPTLQTRKSPLLWGLGKNQKNTTTVSHLERGDFMMMQNLYLLTRHCTPDFKFWPFLGWRQGTQLLQTGWPACLQPSEQYSTRDKRHSTLHHRTGFLLDAFAWLQANVMFQECLKQPKLSYDVQQVRHSTCTFDLWYF